MSILKSIYRSVREKLYGVRSYEVPSKILDRIRPLAQEEMDELLESLRANYFSRKPLYSQEFEVFKQSDSGREDIEDHLRRRLHTFRTSAIPWLSSIVDLTGKTVLEIGCGTGSSTVALAEQGAIVTALDEDSGSLCVARKRAALHRTPVTFLEANSQEAFGSYKPDSFDIVGMFAVVEHMTLDERLSAIREAWSLIKPGGLLVVIETPNRLWLQDSHTSMEDFYWWLPDDLAMLWAIRTPRKDFADAFKEVSSTKTMQERKVCLARWGRGASFHEFCLAFDCKPEDLPVASVMELYFREQRNEQKIHAHMWYRRYEAILHSRHPMIHRGFFLPYLDLAFRKPEAVC